MTMVSYRYILEPYRGQRSRHTCPKCKRRKEFTRYIDTANGLYLADYVGRCNRESKCGYHYGPREFFRDNGHAGEVHWWRGSELWQTLCPPSEKLPIDYIPNQLMEKTWCKYEKNNFIRYLLKVFEKEKVYQLIHQFKLGTSKHWKNEGGLSVVFWQIDMTGKIRQGKVMAYDPETGHRLKAQDEAFRLNLKSERYYPDIGQGAKVFFAGKSLVGRDANLRQCFFGEHQLADRSNSPVAIVESEKTAVIMAAFFPEVVWLATGGSNGARWSDKSVYEVLKDRKVIFYPDLGMYCEWREKAKILGTVCDVYVSDLLERKAVGVDRRSGFDLVDYFIK